MYILFINKAIEPEMSFIAEDDFSMKFLIFFKLCQSPIGEVSAFQMIKWL